jgi:hypothetical protein
MTDEPAMTDASQQRPMRASNDRCEPATTGEPASQRCHILRDDCAYGEMRSTARRSTVS